MSQYQTYIPERFKTTFNGFLRKYPYDGIEAQKKKEARESLISFRAKYHHKSRGKSQFINEIVEAINKGKNTDWIFNGEDEYPVCVFNDKVAAKAVFKLLRKKRLTRYL